MTAMEWFHLLWDFNILWNMVFAGIIVFFQRRNPKSVWAWLLVLFALPFAGSLLYIFFGRDLRKRKIFCARELAAKMYQRVQYQVQQFNQAEGTISKMASRDCYSDSSQDILRYKELIAYNLHTSQAVLTGDNDIDIFTEGVEKFRALKADLQAAERFIHLQYYIIKNDVLLQQIKEILIEKAKEGVEVRVLFDAMGCRSVKRKVWRELQEKGIKTAEFFPPVFRRLHVRMNYRNHRKIVVVDNKVAYVGGYNIGKEYVGLDGRFGKWRDTHLRIQGSGVLGLQLRFLLDWNNAAKENLLENAALLQGMKPGRRDFCNMQIISSGPDGEIKAIRDNYLCLIGKARKKIYIQTPYFIPDEAVFQALLLAIRCGVEVNLMIPGMPDHPFVYWATYSYMGDLVMAGANCYTYHKGFLHCKGIIVDGEVVCLGTANVDIRSFELNFEVNAVIYDEKKAVEMEEIFREDMKECTRITRDMYAARPLRLRVKEQICRLFSPLL